MKVYRIHNIHSAIVREVQNLRREEEKYGRDNSTIFCSAYRKTLEQILNDLDSGETLIFGP